MCEPSCIKYTGGSSFTCSDKATARAVAKRTYESAVELFAILEHLDLMQLTTFLRRMHGILEMHLLGPIITI